MLILSVDKEDEEGEERGGEVGEEDDDATKVVKLAEEIRQLVEGSEQKGVVTIEEIPYLSPQN